MSLKLLVASDQQLDLGLHLRPLSVGLLQGLLKRFYRRLVLVLSLLQSFLLPQQLRVPHLQVAIETFKPVDDVGLGLYLPFSDLECLEILFPRGCELPLPRATVPQSEQPPASRVPWPALWAAHESAP